MRNLITALPQYYKIFRPDGEKFPGIPEGMNVWVDAA